MAQDERSVTMTCLLCVVLFAANFGLQYYSGIGFLSLLVVWPVLFVLCVWIAARIWHGHNTL